MTSITTKPFDAAKYIDDDATQAELLDEALATGDRAVVVHALSTIARARGMTDLARKTGISRTTLYAMVDDTGNPTLDAFLKIVSALDLSIGARRAEPEKASAAA